MRLFIFIVLNSLFIIPVQAGWNFFDFTKKGSTSHNQAQNKKFKFFFYEEDAEEDKRSPATGKKSLEEFSTEQISSLKVAELKYQKPSRLKSYLAGNSIELGAEYPINFGVHFTSRANGDFYARFGFGFVTEFFLGGFSKLAPNFSYLNRQEADLISDVVKNSLYSDVRIGWSPYYEKHASGPYLELGVTGMFFGRGRTSGLTLSKALSFGDESKLDYSIKSNIYSASFHVGYQISMEKHVNVHFELGALKVFKVHFMDTGKDSATAISSEIQHKFRNFMLKKGWIFPTGSIWFGFSF